MNRIFTSLLLIGFFFTSRAQEDKKYNKLYLDLNMGACWQNPHDVSIDKLGLGWGWGLGKWYMQNETHTFDIGWHFRYLSGMTYGQNTHLSHNIAQNAALNGAIDPTMDYTKTSGYVYHNYMMSFEEVALELKFGLNRLREKTGIICYFWGGVGLTHSSTKIDQRDASGMLYDYSKIDSTASASTIKSQLSTLRDGSYETYSEGGKPQWRFMPSAGIGLGYQWGGFGIGTEFKLTWGLTNQLDGDQHNTAMNDIYYYGGAYMRFRLGGGTRPNPVKSDQNNYTNNPVNNTNTVVVNNPPPPPPPPPGKKPTVIITTPSSPTSSTGEKTAAIVAYVYNVNNQGDIQFSVNGIPSQGFSFNPASKQLNANVNLSSGNNSVVITGINPFGSDTKVANISYSETMVTPGSKPIVIITSPAANPFSTMIPSVTITATVQNVLSQADIKVKVNGSFISNFTYNTATKVVSFTESYNPGSNPVEIAAFNQYGSDIKTTTIIYNQPGAQKPVIVFIVPSSNPYTTSVASMNITANVQNVSSQGQIQVKVNGTPVTNFTFEKLMVKFNYTFNTGSNTVEVSAANSFGSDSKSTTIIYNNQPGGGPKPVVTILNPSTSPFTTTSPTLNISATVQNVSSQSDVHVKVNGMPFSAFTYYNGNIQFSFTFNAGTSSVEVSGTNQYGSDSKTATIIYNQPVGLKPIVIITSPAANPYNTPAATGTVTGKVLNVNSQSEIHVTQLGGQSVPFSYDMGSKVITFSYSMASMPTNTFTIMASNSNGSDSKSVTIKYIGSSNTNTTGNTQVGHGGGGNTQSGNTVTSGRGGGGGGQQKPVITITSPSPAASIKTPDVTVTATVTNMNSANGITAKVNGNPISGISYSNGTITFTAPLNTGSNTITITATNSGGTDTKTFSLTRN